MSETQPQMSAATTVGELAKQNRGIIAACQDCDHRRMLGVDAMLRFDPATPLADVHKRLKCGCCNSKLITCKAEGE